MHIFYCGGKRKTKAKWRRRSVVICFFAHSASLFQFPCMHIFHLVENVYKDTHIFLHGKEKSKRRMLFFRCFCLFFSVPKYAHRLRLRRTCGKSGGILFFRGKGKIKGKVAVEEYKHLLFRHFCVFFFPFIPYTYT